VFFQEAMPEEGSVPGAVIAIQSFGDFLGLWEVKARPPAKANANILCVAKP